MRSTIVFAQQDQVDALRSIPYELTRKHCEFSNRCFPLTKMMPLMKEMEMETMKAISMHFSLSGYNWNTVLAPWQKKINVEIILFDLQCQMQTTWVPFSSASDIIPTDNDHQGKRLWRWEKRSRFLTQITSLAQTWCSLRRDWVQRKTFDPPVVSKNLEEHRLPKRIFGPLFFAVAEGFAGAAFSAGCGRFLRANCNHPIWWSCSFVVVT